MFKHEDWQNNDISLSHQVTVMFNNNVFFFVLVVQKQPHILYIIIMGYIIIKPVPALSRVEWFDPVYVQSSRGDGFELTTSYYNIRGASSNHCTTTTGITLIFQGKTNTSIHGSHRYSVDSSTSAIRLWYACSITHTDSRRSMYANIQVNRSSRPDKYHFFSPTVSASAAAASSYTYVIKF